MKLIIVAYCGYFLLSLTANSQNIDSTIAKYANDFGTERSYLHFDKSSYVPGETIWFKAYLMKGIFPADESKTFYIDWTDDKGNLVFRNVCPIVNATTNGQIDIPAGYSGKFIHAKAYTRWMLNFDSDFIYNKDIRILSRNPSLADRKSEVIPALQFFPEGGDAIAGVVNKIAFKANDQWGTPIKIKGIIQDEKGITIDTLKVIHDGMGYIFLNPKAGETYTAKWRVDKGQEYTTPLPAIKSSGVAIRVGIVGNKRPFTIDATPGAVTGPIHVIGTMNQFQVFKVSRDISSGTAQAIIPTQDLPTGILTITVFDDQWKALAERITYVNNQDYLFRPEMNVIHWGLNKRAKNEIEIVVPDSLPSNFSISITDIGIDADSSDNIISRLLLTGEIKGQVYNPAYYFLNNSDSISQRLDLVMLTHGWRRFKWEEVAKGKLPKINFPRDTAYLTLSGKVYGVMASQFRGGANIVMIMSQKDAKSKILMVPLEPDGTFNDQSVVLFDTAHIYYHLSKGLEDGSVIFMESRLQGLRNTAVAGGYFYNPSDTSGSFRHFQLSDEAIQLMKMYEGKVLENVIVKTKTRSPLQILDEKYASGLFAGGDSYQFDLVNDATSPASYSIFDYLQGRVAGLQIKNMSSASGTPSFEWRGASPTIYIDEVQTDLSLLSSLSVADVAYIKVFRPPFFGPSSGGSGGAIAIYTRRGSDVKTTPGKGLANNTVTAYTELRQFYSPNYSTFSPGNEKRDLRTTLYWNPQVNTTSQNNKVRLSFYNNDVSKAFRVVIEGMGKDGRLAHLEQTME